MQFDFLERRLSLLFYHYGKFVSRHSIFFLICPLLLTVVLLLGCVWFLEVIPDSISLYTPEDGAARHEQRVLDEMFPINDTSEYYVERRFDATRLGYMIVTSNPPGDNILQSGYLNETLQLWGRIESLHVWESGAWLNYKLLCLTFPHSLDCIHNALLDEYQKRPELISKLKYPFTQNGIYTGALLGGVSSNPSSQIITSVRAILLPYQLRHGTARDNLRAQEWECRLEQFLSRFKSEKLTVRWWTSETLATEARQDTAILVRLLGPLFLLVSAFTIACCMVGSWVRSKPWLGVGGVVSASCAIVSAIGLLSYAGVKFTSVAYFVPFVVFSIGVDNVFILLAAWQKTSTRLSHTERMGRTFQDAGVSITVTTLTDGLSFGVGCMTSFLSVKIFCAYAAVAIFFVYLYQLTFFAAVMVLSGLREASQRHCLMFWPMRNRKACPVPNTIPASDNLYKNYETDERSHGTTEGVHDHVLSRFFRTHYTQFITHPVTQGVVIVLFFVYIGIAAWGCVGIQVGLEPTDLLPQHSLARETLDMQEQYFSQYSLAELHVIFTNLSQKLDFESKFWFPIEHELDRFENTKFTGYADSWLRIFLAFCRTSKLDLRPDNFVPMLQNVFLKLDIYAKYRHDILFNEIDTRIDAARFIVRMRNVGFGNQTQAMNYLRGIARDSGRLNVTIFTPFFKFADQFTSILSNTIMNVAIASAVVVLVSLLLIPKPLCSIWVSLTIASINIGIIGYMSLWGVKLDFVSMVTIIMSIGFCVDFSAHIAYHFAKGKGMDPVERVRCALHSVGTPILQSAISTMIGVSLLTMVENYVYRSFLKTIMLVIWFGTFHGLVVLPVLLTLFYCDCRSRGTLKSTTGTGRTPSTAVNENSTASVDNPSSATTGNISTAQSSIAHIYGISAPVGNFRSVYPPSYSPSLMPNPQVTSAGHYLVPYYDGKSANNIVNDCSVNGGLVYSKGGPRWRRSDVDRGCSTQAIDADGKTIRSQSPIGVSLYPSGVDNWSMEGYSGGLNGSLRIQAGELINQNINRADNSSQTNADASTGAKAGSPMVPRRRDFGDKKTYDNRPVLGLL